MEAMLFISRRGFLLMTSALPAVVASVLYRSQYCRIQQMHFELSFRQYEYLAADDNELEQEQLFFI